MDTQIYFINKVFYYFYLSYLIYELLISKMANIKKCEYCIISKTIYSRLLQYKFIKNGCRESDILMLRSKSNYQYIPLKNSLYINPYGVPEEYAYGAKNTLIKMLNLKDKDLDHFNIYFSNGALDEKWITIDSSLYKDRNGNVYTDMYILVVKNGNLEYYYVKKVFSDEPPNLTNNDIIMCKDLTNSKIINFNINDTSSLVCDTFENLFYLKNRKITNLTYHQHPFFYDLDINSGDNMIKEFYNKIST